jgi:hypothetical protein
MFNRRKPYVDTLVMSPSEDSDQEEGSWWEALAASLFGDMALFATMCLVGGVFLFLWGEHPALMIAGIAMFAVVGGWLGYSFRNGVDPQSSTSRRIRTAAAGGLLAGLAAFEVSIVFCSCG